MKEQKEYLKSEPKTSDKRLYSKHWTEDNERTKLCEIKKLNKTFDNFVEKCRPVFTYLTFVGQDKRYD